MKLNKTKILTYIEIIISAVVLISVVFLMVSLNFKIGFPNIDDGNTSQVAQAVVGVIFVAVLLIVLSAFAVYTALECCVVLAVVLKGKPVRAIFVVSAVVKFIFAAAIAFLSVLILGVSFWLAGIFAVVFSIASVATGVFDIISFKEVGANCKKHGS